MHRLICSDEKGLLSFLRIRAVDGDRKRLLRFGLFDLPEVARSGRLETAVPQIG